MQTFLAAMLLAAAPNLEVRTLDGATYTGSPVELSQERVRLDTSSGPVAIGVDRLLTATTVASTTPFPQATEVAVELVDGSRLSARAYSATQTTALVQLTGGESLKIPTAQVAFVRLLPLEATLADQWSQILGQAATADLLVVRKDQSLDYLEGVLRDIHANTVNFELDGEVLEVKRSKVVGLAYFHARGDKFDDAIARVIDRGGSTFQARSLSLAGDRLQIALGCGLEISRPLAAVDRLDFSEGKVIHLEDLDNDYKWTPVFGTADPESKLAALYRPRAATSDQPLHVAGRSYTKGVALRSRTQASYRVPESFRRFVAVAGLDDSAPRDGHVRLSVADERSELLSVPIRAGETPLAIDLEIAGARRLTVLVDFGENLDIGDQLNLCEARITK